MMQMHLVSVTALYMLKNNWNVVQDVESALFYDQAFEIYFCSAEVDLYETG